MIDFYLNDDMIEYFKIYEVFEKNGVFDSTWQKNVSNEFKVINHSLNELINSIDY